MCIVCDLGRSPTLEEIKGATLDIFWCQKVTEIQVPEGIQELYCGDCPKLASLRPLPKSLEILSCRNCTNLTSLGPLPESLQELDCSYCTSLTSLGPLAESLQIFSCIGCTNLTSLGPLPKGLQILSCGGCTSLTSLGLLPKSLQTLYCGDCPVLTSVGPRNLIDNLRNYLPSFWTPSEELEENLKKLVIIQRFCRSLRTRKLLRLSRTREFCEFFYHPENYGGRWAKASLEKFAKKL